MRRSRPPPAPGTAAPTTAAPLVPHQITIGQMYVQFQIPARVEAADFDGIPYLALKGHYTYTATSTGCPDTVNAINARRADKTGTAKAEDRKLDEMGLLGVTHMMMLDKKNLEIADILYNWIGRNVRRGNGRR